MYSLCHMDWIHLSVLKLDLNWWFCNIVDTCKEDLSCQNLTQKMPEANTDYLAHIPSTINF